MAGNVNQNPNPHTGPSVDPTPDPRAGGPALPPPEPDVAPTPAPATSARTAPSTPPAASAPKAPSAADSAAAAAARAEAARKAAEAEQKSIQIDPIQPRLPTMEVATADAPAAINTVEAAPAASTLAPQVTEAVPRPSQVSFSTFSTPRRTVDERVAQAVTQSAETPNLKLASEYSPETAEATSEAPITAATNTSLDADDIVDAEGEVHKIADLDAKLPGGIKATQLTPTELAEFAWISKPRRSYQDTTKEQDRELNQRSRAWYDAVQERLATPPATDYTATRAEPSPQRSATDYTEARAQNEGAPTGGRTAVERQVDDAARQMWAATEVRPLTVESVHETPAPQSAETAGVADEIADASAEEALRMESLDELVAYLDEREAAGGLPGQVSGRIRELVTLLSDPELNMNELDVAEIDAELAALQELAAQDRINRAAAAGGGGTGNGRRRRTRNGGDDGDGGEGSDDAGSTGSRPKSRSRLRIEATMAKILENLSDTSPAFALTGDRRVTMDSPKAKGKKTKNGQPKTVEVTMHSVEVQAEIIRTLQFFGYDVSSIEDAQALEFRLFQAFQIYRGISVDRNGLLFGKKKKESKVSDDMFIDCLKEMRNNVLTHNHPFAYTHPHKVFGGRLRFPLITTPGLAQFFTKNEEGNRLDMTPEQFIKYNVQQYNDIVQPRILDMAKSDQREVLFDIVDAVLSRSPELVAAGATPRGIDDRLTLDELLDPELEFAELYNQSALLAAVAQARLERTVRAATHMDKRLGRGGRDKVKTSDDVGKNMQDYWAQNLNRAQNMRNPIYAAAKGVSTIARIMGVVGRPALFATGILEKARGIGDTWTAQKVRRLAWLSRGVDVEVGDRALELMDEFENVDAIDEALQVAASQGMDGLHDACANGAIFGQGAEKAAARAEADKGNAAQRFGKHLMQVLDGTAHWAMTVSVGDWFGNRTTARIFLREYYMQMADKARRDGVSFTSAQLDAAFVTDPAGFITRALLEPEGKAALVYASQTSLGGINLLTEAMRRGTQNPLIDAAVGGTVSWYMRYGINAGLRQIPFSMTLTLLAKHYGYDVIHDRIKGGAIDSDEYTLGSDFQSGLYQSIILDLAHAGSSATAFLVLLGIVSALGVEPPDDEEKKKHLWYEWKIGGQAIKENWFWNDMLGIAMPAVVGIKAGALTGDSDLAYRLISQGVFEKVQENPWAKVSDVIDLINNFDRNLVQAQQRAEGYADNGPISDFDFIWTQIIVFMIRRGYATFEPAVIRDFYNEHALGGNDADLAHSRNTVYEPNTKAVAEGKLPETRMTTWADAQVRGAAMSSPLTGFLLNVVNGVYANNQDIRRTGYLRDEMPLITNVDPLNQMYIDRLSVRSEDGTFLPVEVWSPKQKQGVINAVVKMLKDFEGQPAKLAAQGGVVPYDARKLTIEYLHQLNDKLRGDYEIRKANGEWDYKANGLGYTATAKLQKEAWDTQAAAADRNQALIDMLKGDEIPYSALKYNRWETSYRPVFVWKDGTPDAGKPATWLDYKLHGDEVTVELYASGDHKSGLIPWLTVDDEGDRSYDAQTPVSWQSDLTDPGWVKGQVGDYTIGSGTNQGRRLWDVLTGGGATGPDAHGPVRWNMNEFLTGSRALRPVREPYEKYVDTYKAPDWSKVTKAAGGRVYSSGGGWGGGGGGDFAPKIYSHPAYSLNTDKPAAMYTKTPTYARFDYLRPSVETKGSREAYRREDF